VSSSVVNQALAYRDNRAAVQDCDLLVTIPKAEIEPPFELHIYFAIQGPDRRPLGQYRAVCDLSNRELEIKRKIDVSDDTPTIVGRHSPHNVYGAMFVDHVQCVNEGKSGLLLWGQGLSNLKRLEAAHNRFRIATEPSNLMQAATGRGLATMRALRSNSGVIEFTFENRELCAFKRVPLFQVS
jgi:hypothetical protein